MANVKFTAKDEQFIAACARMNGAVGEMAAKINIQLANSFKQADYLSNNFSKGIGRAGDQIQTFGEKMSMYVTTPLIGAGVAMAKTFMDIDSLKRGLQSTMGSAAAASKEFENLKEVAKLPGLGMEEAAQGSVMLQAAGMSANFARRELLAVGNALATVGKGKFELQRVNDQLVQIYNKTSGFGEDVKTISQSLPQLRKVMMEAFGTMDTEAISKKFTGKEFVEKMVVALEKLPKATGGFKNAWENLTDSLKIGSYEIFQIAERSFDLTGKLDGISKVVTDLVASFKELSPENQKLILSIGGAAAAIGPLAIAIGSITKLVPVLATGLGALSTPMVAIGALAGSIAYYWDTFNAILDKTIARLYQIKGALLMAMGQSGAAVKAFEVGDLWWKEGKNRDAAIVAPQIKAREDMERQAMLLRNAARREARYGNGSVNTVGGLGDVKSASEIEAAAKKATKALLEMSDARIKAGLEAIKYRDIGGHSVAGAVGVLPNKDVKQSSYLLNGQLTQMTTGVQGGMSEMLKNFKMPSGEEMIQAAKKIKVGLNTELLELRSSIVETLSQTASDAFVGMGEVVSAMISGTAGIANLGKMLGSVIGGTLQQIGKALVGFGVAKLNIDKLIAVPGFGAAAAIAGGALIAGLGATLKNITTPKAFASGGMVYSPTRALFGEYPGASSNPEVVAPLNTLLGMIQKTVEPIMLARMSPIPALRGSGGGGLEGILRGEDVYIQQRRVAASNAALRG